MEIAVGGSIADQIAYGRVRFLRRPPKEITEFSRLNWEEEVLRFQKAQGRAVLQLAALHDRALHQVGEGMASIFAIHALLLEDEDLVDSICTLVRERGVTAEYAVQTVCRSFREAFSSMDSPYMRARAADIRDISNRMLRLLLSSHRPDPLRLGPAILVSDEFFPSEVMELDHRRLLGLVARQGSVDSHTARLLQAFRIPALTEAPLGPEWDGHLALLDGFDRRLYLDPDREVLDRLRLRYQAGGMPPQARRPAEG